MLSGLMSTMLNDLSVCSKCQRLTRRSSADTNVSPSALGAMLLMWYAWALPYIRMHLAASCGSTWTTLRGGPEAEGGLARRSRAPECSAGTGRAREAPGEPQLLCGLGAQLRGGRARPHRPRDPRGARVWREVEVR